MEKLLNDFSVGLFFWQTLLFIVLLFLLRKFAWKPILNAVNEREDSIKEALNAAEDAKREMAKLKSSNEDLLNQARAERDEMLKEARGIKDNIVANAKTTAKVEAEKIVAAARESIQHEKMAAITELKNQVAVLSIEIAEKILKNELSSADKQKTIIDNIVKDIHLN
ncbi:MAG: ATP synthase F0 subunit B [Flavobacteriales bacterium CG_4_10_14_0_2_um_filter_32_8]|nr:MAG: ATP synthase F0 subunit B [Flavobacteriales bacterium CG_4_10_14_0_2_um_filter_32_8]PJB14391.1 MAG: ATP synthase F0 subunit B [Flavobacteriales bacterium CG_4_9_14_3_um_filter_32_8]